jgi:ABC-type multidrug transport system fused ATPase/permease subunit
MRKLKLGNIPWLIVNVIHTIFFVSLSGWNIYLLKVITDYGLAREMDKVLQTAQLMLAIMLGSLILDSIGTLLKSKYLETSLKQLKNHYIHQLMEQDITQLQKEQCNIYRSNLTNDFDRFEEKFLFNVLEIIHMASRFLMSVVIVATVSLYLVAVAFAMLVIFVFITGKTNKPVQKSEAKKSKSLQEYTDFVNETLNGFEIIKQHQLQNLRFDAFVSKATKVQKDNYTVDKQSTKVDALNNFIQTSIIFTLIVSGILFARSAEASLGSLIMVATSFGNVMWPLQRFTPVITQMKGIINVLDEFDKNLNRPFIDRHIRVNDFQSLLFEHCDLGYEDDPQPILQSVNLDINKSEKVLIVGHSGAGKSTVLKTIRQSILPKNGWVRLDQTNIFDIVPIDYYSLFATVDQIGFIFNGTILDNVTMYQPMDEQKVRDALNQVGLSDLDIHEPLRNNGANVSGGQRARLMLARALCLNSEVILCDEIFSSLEQSIARSIERDILNLNKTIINVSHIIFKDQLPLYDKIYIVDQGTIRLTSDIQEVWSRMILTDV